jgi:hypothetical protein
VFLLVISGLARLHPPIDRTYYAEYDDVFSEMPPIPKPDDPGIDQLFRTEMVH